MKEETQRTESILYCPVCKKKCIVYNSKYAKKGIILGCPDVKCTSWQLKPKKT